MTRRTICMLLLLVPLASADTADLRHEVLWSIPGQGGFSAPNAVYDPGSDRPSAIAVTERDVGVALFDMQGNRLWTYPMDPPVSAPVAVGDVTGDGRDNIVAADAKGALVCLDDSGRPVWTTRLPAGVAAESCPAIVDLDGDGAPEILVGDTGGSLSCLDHTGALLWRFAGDGGRMGPVLVADLYQEPGKEIVVTSHDRHIYALSATGEWLWDIFRADDLFPNSTPVLADVDGDGVPELYVGGGLHHFYRIDVRSGAVAHEENVYLHVNAAIGAADLNGDGRDAVVFGNKGGAVRCYGADGFEWTLEFPKSSIYAAPVFLNIDGGPAMHALLLGRSGDMYLLGPAGTVIASGTLPSEAAFTPLAGDLTGDGRWNVVAAADGWFSGRGAMAMIDLGLPYHPDPRNTRAFAGDRARSGVVAGGRAFDPVPRPPLQPAPAPGAVALKPVSEPALFGGTSAWRFDVDNPDAARLAVMLEVAAPDGVVSRTVRHVRGTAARLSFPVRVEAPGAYRIREVALDADSRLVMHDRVYELAYAGPTSDRDYLNAKVFTPAAEQLTAWESTNPRASHAARHRLSAMQGELRGLMDVTASDGAPIVEQMARLRRQAEHMAAFSAAGVVRAHAGSFFVWPFNPWAHFDPAVSLPAPDTNSAAGLEADLCIGEYQSLALNVTNVCGRTLDLRVRAVAAEAGAPTLELRRAVMVPTLRREEIADALVPLDEAGMVRIAPFESEQLWLTVNAADAQPGVYTLELRLKSVETDPTEMTVPVKVTVHDLALPRPRPLRFCLWSYDGGELGTDRPHVLQDLVEHGVTVFFGKPPVAECNDAGEIVGELDFAAHDESVRRLAPHGFLLFSAPQRSLTGQPAFSEPWRRAFVAYMRRWAAHMESLGVGFDRWAVYSYDEPSSPYNEHTLQLVEVSKLVREADPRILNYANPTSGTTMETVRMFSGVIDIWCPSAELLERLGDELVPEAHRVGKELWFYDASGGAKTLSTLGLYRWRFWYAWNLGMTGTGWWTYAYHGEADRWDGPNVTNDFFDTVYEGTDRAVIGSKRWESSREGVQDYEYLVMLREALRQAEARGASGADLERARAILGDRARSMEALLHLSGRRLPLTTDSVPLYNDVHNRLQEMRAMIRETCASLLNVAAP